MDNKTKIILAWELHQSGMNKTHIGASLTKNRETIRLWIQGIEKYGLESFLDLYARAKKGEGKLRQIDPILKRRVWEIREREKYCCGQKIQYFLQQEYDTHISVPKIYEILHEKYKISSKWKKNIKRGETPLATAPRKVIQMDTVDFGNVFAFTGIDIYTR